MGKASNGRKDLIDKDVMGKSQLEYVQVFT